MADIILPALPPTATLDEPNKCPACGRVGASRLHLSGGTRRCMQCAHQWGGPEFTAESPGRGDMVRGWKPSKPPGKGRRGN